MPIFLPRIESERSVSGIASATSGSLTITSEKLLVGAHALRLADRDLARSPTVRPAVSSISRACAARRERRQAARRPRAPARRARQRAVEPARAMRGRVSGAAPCSPCQFPIAQPLPRCHFSGAPLPVLRRPRASPFLLPVRCIPARFAAARHRDLGEALRLAVRAGSPRSALRSLVVMRRVASMCCSPARRSISERLPSEAASAIFCAADGVDLERHRAHDRRPVGRVVGELIDREHARVLDHHVVDAVGAFSAWRVSSTSTWSPGSTKPRDAFDVVDAHRDGAHAVLDHRGERRLLPGPGDLGAQDRLVALDRGEHDALAARQSARRSRRTCRPGSLRPAR